MDGIQCEEVFDFMGDFSGLTVLVNWRALEARDIGPDSLVHYASRNKDRTLGETFDGILASLDSDQADLDYAIVAGVVVISTTDDLAALGELRLAEARRPVPVEPADRAVYDALARVTKESKPIWFRQIPLVEVMIYVADLTGVGISVDWDGLAQVGVVEETTVAFHAETQLTGFDLLWFVLLDAGGTGTLTYTIEDGQVRILPASAE
jgi:hypothetical protein